MQVTLVLAMLTLAACATATPGKPVVFIDAPASGAHYREGDEVVIESTSEDARAVLRVEVLVDGIVIRTDNAPTPQGVPSFPLAHKWKATRGAHTLSVRAYNIAGQVSDPVGVTLNVAPAIAQAQTPSASPTVAPTALVAPSVSPTACRDAATFVSETIPDRTNFASGSAFVKIWRLRNSGTCAWGAGYTLAHAGGEAMSEINFIAVPPTAPNALAELSVPMRAPDAAGLHSGAWQLKSDRGAAFGLRVTALINTTAPASAVTATPSAPATASAGCSGAPTLSTFTVTTEQIMHGATTRIQWGVVTNASSVRVEPDVGIVETPGVRDVSPKATTTYTLTARCGANTRTAQITIIVNPAGSATANFTGVWTHNFGTMTIVQSGNTIINTSKYTNEFTSNKASGNIAGTISGNTVSGTWTIEGADGILTFYLGTDGNTFDGSWTSGSQQFRWCGARPGAPFPSGCSFAGLWTMAAPGIAGCNALTLTRIDDSITGNYCGARLSGTLRYAGSETILTGNATIGGAQNPFTFYLLDGYNGTLFNGDWNNNAANEWCGWRASASKPTPCGR